MLHVNEDTNDELFRKAAEDYILRADNPDWETILNKMNTGNPSMNETATRKKRGHFRFLFTGSRSIFRLFRFSAWLEKGKKKINPGMLHRLPGILPAYMFYIPSCLPAVDFRTGLNKIY